MPEIHTYNMNENTYTPFISTEKQSAIDKTTYICIFEDTAQYIPKFSVSNLQTLTAFWPKGKSVYRLLSQTPTASLSKVKAVTTVKVSVNAGKVTDGHF